MLSRRDLLRYTALTTVGAFLTPTIFTSCSSDPETTRGHFDYIRTLREGLRASPDHLLARAARLLKERDAAGIFHLVRDRVQNYPGTNPRFPFQLNGANSVRWGGGSILRGGAGTLRERAELLHEMLQGAGFEVELLSARKRLDLDLQKRLLFRPLDVSFRPELPDWWSEVPAATDQITPIDVDGQSSAAWTERLLEVLPEMPEEGEQSFAVRDETIPIVKITTDTGVRYLDLTELDRPFEEQATTEPKGLQPLARAGSEYGTLQLRFLATFSDAPDEPVVWQEYSAPYNEVVGNQIAVACLPDVPLEMMAGLHPDQARSFVPVIRRVDARAPQEVPTQVTAFTRSGQRIESKATGEISIDGQPIGRSAEPSGLADRVQTLTGKINAAGHPTLDLYLRATDGDGTAITGMHAADFQVTQDDQPLRALLLANNFAPRILILQDTTSSMPREYRRGTAMTEIIDLIRERLSGQFPFAQIKLRPEIDTYYELLTEAAAESWDAIVVVSDGKVIGKFEERMRGAFDKLPPVLFAHVSAKVDPAVAALQTHLPDMQTVSAANRTALVDRLEVLVQNEQPPVYHLEVGVTEPRGVVTVQVGDAPPLKLPYKLSDRDRIPSRLAGLALEITTADRQKHWFQIGGYDPRLDDAVTEEHVAAADAALFGETLVCIEGSRPSESVWLDELYLNYLRYEPLTEALEDESIDGKSLLQQLGGLPPLVSWPYVVMAPPVAPVSEEHLTYVNGLQIAIVQRRPLPGYERVESRVDVLPTTDYRTLGRAAFRTNLRNTLRSSLTEQALYESSTLDHLDRQGFVYYNDRLRDRDFLTNDLRGAWVRMLRAHQISTSKYAILGPADGQPGPYLAIHTKTGAVLSLLPDGTGGGITKADIMARIAAFDRQVAILNLMIAGVGAAGGVGAGGGAALGIAVAYFQMLARIYGAATLAILYLNTAQLDRRIRGAIARGICEALRGLAMGVFAPMYSNFENVVVGFGGTIPSPCDLGTPDLDLGK